MRGERERRPSASRRGPAITSSAHRQRQRQRGRDARQVAARQRHARECHAEQDRQREQVDQRLGEDRPGDDRHQPLVRPRGGARAPPRAWARRCGPGTAPRPSRRSSSRARPRPRHRRVGQRRAQRLRARRPSASASPATSTPAPARSSRAIAVTSACPTRCSSRRESAKATSPASGITTRTMPTRLRAGRRDRTGVLAVRHFGGVYQVGPLCSPRSDEARSSTRGRSSTARSSPRSSRAASSARSRALRSRRASSRERTNGRGRHSR